MFSRPKERLAKAAMAKSASTQVQILGDYEDDRSKFQSLSNSLEVEYDSNNNVTDNGVKNSVIANTAHASATGNPHSTAIEDITDLSSILDGKQSTISGYTGTTTVVTSVDFTNSTTTTVDITIDNGIVTGVS